MDTLIKTWVLNEPDPEHFSHIVPVDVIPPVSPDTDKEALYAGEQALRDGRVATFVVAGGQGTRLGFDKPKGAYPIGPLTNKTLFRYHAEKIHNLQRRYETTIPWYIMVSPTNDTQTRDYFRGEEYFGLDPNHILFCRQKTVPCVDESGKFILDAPCQPAVSPTATAAALKH